MKLIAPPPLLIILGSTASGKSGLAHQIARSRNGEIVSADAFAVYRGFDIGTAKPSVEQREELDYRAARYRENPADVTPWEQVRADLHRNR